MSVYHWILKKTNKSKNKNGWVGHRVQEYPIYTEVIIETNL